MLESDNVTNQNHTQMWSYQDAVRS